MNNKLPIFHFTNRYANSNVDIAGVRISYDKIGTNTNIPYVIASDVITRDKQCWTGTLDLVGSSISNKKNEYTEIYNNITNDVSPVINATTLVPKNGICGRTKQLLLPTDNNTYVNVTPLESSAVHKVIHQTSKKHNDDSYYLKSKFIYSEVGGINPQNVSAIAAKRNILQRMIFCGAPHTPDKFYKYTKHDFYIKISSDHYKQLEKFNEIDTTKFNKIYQHNAHSQRLNIIIKHIIIDFNRYYRSQTIDINDLTEFNKNILTVQTIDKILAEKIFDKIKSRLPLLSSDDQQSIIKTITTIRVPQ